MSAPLPPAQLARLSLATRSAVESCGGVDGAAATTGRSRSCPGRWMNRNEPASPPLDAALALDSAVALQGRAPPILTAYARELGHVAIRLPDAPEGASAWHQSIGAVTRQVGEAIERICTALGDDGEVSGREVAKLNIVGEIDEAIEALVAARALSIAASAAGAVAARDGAQ